MIDGMEEVNARFRETLERIGNPMTERAITLFSQAAMAYSAENTPVATSNLINSAFRRVMPTTHGWRSEFGYGADYAIYVHDAPGTLLGTNTPRSPESDGVVWGPSGEPEFLEKGVDKAVTMDLGDILMNAYVN